MSYKYSTTNYRIPYLGQGDYITEEEERRQMQIIDNILYANNYGATSCIIEQGNYSMEYVENSGWRLKITSAIVGGVSIMGLFNGRLFMKDASSSSEYSVKYSSDYVNGAESPVYYFVRLLDDIDNDSSSFEIVANLSSSIENGYCIAMATFTTVDGTTTATVTPNVNGKIYSVNILSHQQDNTNPHGETLVQNNLVINGGTLSVNGYDVYGSDYGTFTAIGSTTSTWSYTNPTGYVPKFAFVNSPSNSVEVNWSITNDILTFSYVNSDSSDVTINYKIELRQAQ